MTDADVATALAELASNDPDHRIDAIAALSDVDRPDVRDALLDHLRGIRIGTSGQDYEVAPLMGTLAAFGDKRVVSVIVAILANTSLDTGADHQIETAATDALIELGAAEALPVLVEKLLDSKFSAGLEDDFAMAIARIGGEAWSHVLVDALASRRFDLAVAAANALAGIKAPNVEPALHKAAKSKNAALRTAAQLALISRSDMPADGLRTLLATGGGPGWQHDVIYALGRMNQPALSAVMLGVLGDMAWADWRFLILRLLVDQRAPGTDAVLQSIFSDPKTTPWVRGTAAALLLKLGFRSDLADFLLDLAGDVRAIEASDETRPNEFDSAELVVDVLSSELRQDPARFYRWVTLLDAHRKREPKRGKLQLLAGAALSKIVGSQYFAAHVTWIESFAGEHHLG